MDHILRLGLCLGPEYDRQYRQDRYEGASVRAGLSLPASLVIPRCSLQKVYVAYFTPFKGVLFGDF